MEEKRTMLLGVFIGRHTLDAENIYNELIDGKLDSDMLDQIFKLKLTEDEIEKIKNNSGKNSCKDLED